MYDFDAELQSNRNSPEDEKDQDTKVKWESQMVRLEDICFQKIDMTFQPFLFKQISENLDLN